MMSGKNRESACNKLAHFEMWLKSCRYSSNTIKSYVYSLRVYLDFFRNKDPADITDSDFIRFNNEYILKNYYSASYQNQVINAIKLFYQKIEHRQLSVENIERPRKYRPLPKVIPKEGVERMLTKIPNFKHKTALTLIYACGLRRGELINLQLKHLDSKRFTLTVINGKGQKDRVLPVSKKLMDMIIRYYRMYKPKIYLIEGRTRVKNTVKPALKKYSINIWAKYIKIIILRCIA
jgi:integrase/recombinase XerD